MPNCYLLTNISGNEIRRISDTDFPSHYYNAPISNNRIVINWQDSSNNVRSAYRPETKFDPDTNIGYWKHSDNNWYEVKVTPTFTLCFTDNTRSVITNC